MEQAFESFAHAAGLALEVVGIFTIVAGVFAATIVLFADVAAATRSSTPTDATARMLAGRSCWGSNSSSPPISSAPLPSSRPSAVLGCWL